MGIKIKIDEFVEEIVQDLTDCEVDEKDIKIWEETFRKMLLEHKISKKNISETIKGLFFVVNDEMEIFSITQDYIDAIENNDLKTYWNTFK